MDPWDAGLGSRPPNKRPSEKIFGPGLIFYLSIWIAAAATWAAFVCLLFALQFVDFNAITSSDAFMSYIRTFCSILIGLVIVQVLQTYDNSVSKYYSALQASKRFAADLAPLLKDVAATDDGQKLVMMTIYIPYFIHEIFFVRVASDTLDWPRIPNAELRERIYAQQGAMERTVLMDRAIIIIETLVNNMLAKQQIDSTIFRSIVDRCTTFRNELVPLLPTQVPSSASLAMNFVKLILYIYFAVIAFYLVPSYGWATVLLYPILIFIIASMLPFIAFMGSPFKGDNLPFKRIYHVWPHESAATIDGLWEFVSPSKDPHKERRLKQVSKFKLF